MSEKQDENPTPDESAEKPQVVNVRGVDYTLEPGALDDFELLDDLNEVEVTNNAARMPSILRRLLGRPQSQAALDTLRDPATGRITVDAGAAFVNELWDAINPN